LIIESENKTLLHPSSVNSTVNNSSISQGMLDLLQQLSVKEKVALLAGRVFSSLAAIPRLSISAIKVYTRHQKIVGTMKLILS
jgi:hypothetical protein